MSFGEIKFKSKGGREMKGGLEINVSQDPLWCLQEIYLCHVNAVPVFTTWELL